MPDAFGKKTSRLDRLFDRLVGRTGAILVILLIGVTASVSIGMLRGGTEAALSVQAHSHNLTVQDVALAIADISRLQGALGDISQNGSGNAALRAEFESARVSLAGHLDNIQNSGDAAIARAESEAALQELTRLVEALAAINLHGPAELQQALDTLMGVAVPTREAMSVFMEALYIDQRAMLTDTVGSLEFLSRVAAIALLLTSAAGLALCVLLRSEVRHRQRRAKAEARAVYMAFNDSLTGVANRTWFNEHSDQFLRHRSASNPGPRGLALIDMNKFRDINEVYGNEVGDTLLKQIASRLRLVAQDVNGHVARLAGDEFVVLLPFGGQDELHRFAQEVIGELSKPFRLSGCVVAPSFSLGLISSHQVTRIDDVSSEMMTKLASFALIEAKRCNDLASYKVFDDALEGLYLHRGAKFVALVAAIAQNDLEVWLQPQIDLSTLELAGFEALVRWRMDGTIIPPDEFISIAEDNGLIADIDNFMLGAATKSVAEWNARNETSAGVSVNLSAVNITSPALVDDIVTALENSGLPANLLTLEVTESIEVRDWEQVTTQLNTIRSLGCRVSIDDFGSGYSSLGYLRKMPADELKIDKSLVDGVETSDAGRWIVSSVVDIAHTLNFETVIEGIETIGQARISMALGCSLGQGYLFGRPIHCKDLPPLTDVFPRDVLIDLCQDAAPEKLKSLRRNRNEAAA